MRIDALNSNVLNTNEVYIHDCIFEELKFDYWKKRLYLFLKKQDSSIPSFSIEFVNVIGYKMISSDFWGKSPHVLDWEFVKREDSILLNELYEEKEKNLYAYSMLEEDKRYIESSITFVSGDKLTICCEYINY